MALTLELLKTYLRVDGGEDDGVLALFLSAAKEHLEDAGVPERISAQYDLALSLYVMKHYDPPANQAKAEQLERSLVSIIQQLKASAGGEVL